MNAIDKIVEAAEADLGLGEPNYIQDWYDREFGDLGYNWAWCNAAVTWWAHKSGNAKAVCFSDRGHFAYTVAHAQAFKDRGQWTYGTAGIRRGDIVFFDWGGRDSISAIDHVGLVVDVKSDGIHTIEGNIDDACRRKVRGAYEIAGYGRPAYNLTAPAPSGAYVPPPFPEGLRPNSSNPSARELQSALKVTGFMDLDVPLSDNYGPITQAAVARFYNANPDIRVSTWDIAIGPLGWTRLFTKAYGSTVPAPDPDPEPDPTPEPSKPLDGKTVFREEVYYGAPVNNSVKVVQDALNREFGGVVIDGDFGPQTKAAYAKWQVKCGFTGSDADGNPGPTSLGKLADKYGFTLKSLPAPAPGDDGEPAHNYTRTSWSGKTINVRTKVMLDKAVQLAGFGITLTQGSYNPGGVAASAGTHDGGGVVDISVSGLSGTARTKLVTALRKAGFAAWLRTPSDGFAYHIHACAIGDREMSSGAKRQVQSYFNGRNGLANNGPDNHPEGRPYPSWAGKYDE